MTKLPNWFIATVAAACFGIIGLLASDVWDVWSYYNDTRPPFPPPPSTLLSASALPYHGCPLVQQNGDGSSILASYSVEINVVMWPREGAVCLPSGIVVWRHGVYLSGGTFAPQEIQSALDMAEGKKP